MEVTIVIVLVPTILLLILLPMISDRGGNSVWAKDYPPIDYLKNSQENIDSWRWWKPNSKVEISDAAGGCPRIKNEPGVSSCIFRQAPRCGDFTAHLLGIFLVGLVFRSMFSITRDFSFNYLLFYLFVFSLGLFLLKAGNRVLRVDLYPDRLGIVTKWAFFLRRTTIYKREHILSIKGEIQSSSAMERGQRQPDYKITIGRSVPSYFQVSKTYRLHCNPTQGSWFVGGLNHWKSLSNSH